MASLLCPGTDELYVNRPAQRTAAPRAGQAERSRTELRAQIDAVVDLGLAPTHLDWHCLADGGRADIFDVAMALAKEYGLAARVWLDDGRSKARERGKPVVDNAFLDSFSIDLPDKAATYATNAPRPTARPQRMGRPPSAQHRTVAGDRALRLAGPAKRPFVPHLSTSALSSITKPLRSSTTGHCNRRGTPRRVSQIGSVASPSP